MSLKFVVLTLLVGASIAEEEIFNNDWDQPLDIECPEGQTIKSIYSIHDYSKTDRRWRISCDNTPANVKPNICTWTESYVNDCNKPMLFMCRPNAMIAGISSVHDNNTGDRRTKVRCCRRAGVKARSCSITDYLNNFGGPIDYTVTKEKVLTGLFSYYDNASKDRRYKMIECRVD